MEKIEINTAPQFFLDNRFIAEADGIILEANPASKAGVALSPEKPWEEYRIMPQAILEDEGIYKMWYLALPRYPGVEGEVSCPRCGRKNPGRKVVCVKCGWPLLGIDGMSEYLCHKCLAVSTDGKRWERPDLGLTEYRGSKKNNILDPSVSFGVPAINPLGPAAEKFMSVIEHKGNLHVSVSPDGLRWKMKPKPALPFNADTNNQIIYDPALGKYVAFLRGFPGRRTTVRCEFDDLNEVPWPHKKCRRKPDKTGTRYIEDELETVMDVDKQDPQLPGFDINHISASRYADGVWFGFPGLFRKYPPAGMTREGREEHRYFAQGNDGTFETQLAVSRDGRKWTRPDRRPYVSTGLFGSPDGGLIMIAPGIIRRAGETYQYYFGSRTTHGIFDPGESRRTGAIFRLVQPKDRFISASAGPTGGRLLTPPLIHRGSALELNVDCGNLGEVSVQILDAWGNPMEGFAWEDCDRADLNQIGQKMTWRGRGDVRKTAGRPIRLEFSMNRAKLFTFRFA